MSASAQDGSTPPIPIAKLRAFAIELLTAIRVPESDAETIADCLLYSEERAHSSHGIVRLPVYERGQTVKEGDALFTIVPDSSEHAVELWISGNDTPLVTPGDHVRLQFEGWPALQFAGWPSVAVGTFGGQVVAVDATDDGTGKFRLQVRPDPDDVPWPSERFLRQGVRANGWVMLSQVPLWYEVWRQLNGFPPVVAKDASQAESMKVPKKPKLPY